MLETSGATDKILEKWKAVKLQACTPAWWARGGHPQTLIGHFMPSPQIKESDGERIEIPVSSGDRLISILYKGTSETVVYLFHGLGGHSHGTYMMRAALLAQKLGHTVIMTNHRGCGAGEGMAVEPYHSGRADDLSSVIAHGRQRFPSHRHIAIGFSLSANALLLLAAGLGGEALSQAFARVSSHASDSVKATQPDAAITVNAPIDLAKCAYLLKTGFSRVYDIKFVRDMERLLESKRRAGQDIPKLDLSFSSTLHDFDELYTGPVSGFGSRENYYEFCSAKHYLDRINIPTFMMTAVDDPFIDVASYRESMISRNVIRHIEDHGGHLGYYNGDATPIGTKRWLDYAIWELLKALN